MKSLEQHITKCISILERGDNFIAVHNYLNYQKVSAEDQKKIIAAVQEIQANGHIEIKEPRELRPNHEEDRILGVALILLGLFLIYFLWGKGFVATLPILLVVIGIMALKGQIGALRNYL